MHQHRCSRLCHVAENTHPRPGGGGGGGNTLVVRWNQQTSLMSACLQSQGTYCAPLPPFPALSAGHHRHARQAARLDAGTLPYWAVLLGGCCMEFLCCWLRVRGCAQLLKMLPAFQQHVCGRACRTSTHCVPPGRKCLLAGSFPQSLPCMHPDPSTLPIPLSHRSGCWTCAASASWCLTRPTKCSRCVFGVGVAAA